MRQHIVVFALLLTTLFASTTMAQPPFGRGPGFGPGYRGGHARDSRHHEDHAVIQLLLTHHDRITRKVQNLPNGVETLTESDDPAVAAKIKEHTKAMQHRLEERAPIRMRDPLFAELFRNADKVRMVRKETPNGVRVTEMSEDAAVVRLIQAHASVVSEFVARGFDEARKNHSVPTSRDNAAFQYTNPVVAEYGKVVRLADASHQPRTGSKIVVDITTGGEPGKLNPGIEKVARFVNIYHGAGKSPAEVTICMVLHGDATLTILKADAYSRRFKVDDNPNLDCLQKLQEAGVEILVCGQSLIGKGAKPDEVIASADVAVSALTSLVNLQADGFAYVPLGR